jgi:hypothetical protein
MERGMESEKVVGGEERRGGGDEGEADDRSHEREGEV